MSYSTFLCYGIGVTHESIYYATMADEPLQGPLHFIRLVQHRLARRALSCQNGGAIERLPVEVWQLIRHELVNLELAEARASLDARIKAHHCQDTPRCIATSWQNVESGCSELSESFNAVSGVTFGDEAKACRKLLRRYGLSMPSHRPLFRKWADDHEYRSPATLPDSIVPIALPMHGEFDSEDAGNQPAYEGPEIRDDLIYNDAICNVSFDVPANANLRFAALVRDFHLDPVEIDDGEVRVAGVCLSPLAKRSERMFTRIRPERLRPRWKLFTTVFAEW